jgi:uncharacterized protein YbaP (TraB family)
MRIATASFAARSRRPLVGLLLIALALASLAGPARAEGPAIWSVKSERGEILLLGSVHLLRPDDHPLPANVSAAYEAADRLLMELDESTIDPEETQELLMRVGRFEDGRTLADVMDPADFERAKELAYEIGLPLEMIDVLEPWLAATTIMNLHTMRLGYRPELGLEQHLAMRALRDGKPMAGLETVEFQIALFDGLPADTQSKLMLQTLEEASLLDEQLATLIALWRRGDSAALNRELTRSFDDYPEVYRRLVTDRNRTWTQRLIDTADRDGVTLVVVGALHLVGEDSVVEMLRERGRTVLPWRPAD